MEVHLSPDVQEQLAHGAARQGRDADEIVQEVLAQYLTDEGRFSAMVEGWSVAELNEMTAHIEEGFLESERGELIDGEQARRDIELLKQDWREKHSRSR